MSELSNRVGSSVLLLGVVAVISLAAVARGQMDAAVGEQPESLEAGLVVTDEELPTDEFGVPIVDGFPGVLPTRETSEEAKRELEPLKAVRDQVLSGARAARARVVIPRHASDADAPPDMDSGDKDPDRLRPESQPPVPELGSVQ